MRCRRQDLADLARPTSVHAGLWLDRYLPEQTEGTGNEESRGKKQQLIQEVEALPAPEGYTVAERRRERMLRDTGEVSLATARVEGRLSIGLGQKGALEAGLALERTWGVPILPGSALKGLAAAAAEKSVEDVAWRKPRVEEGGAPGGESHRELFGTVDDEGAVVFHDAWWIPDGPDPRIPIHLDVMTVHHQAYYQTGSAPPRDTDDPNPIPFATVSGRFRVAVEGPKEWREAALQLLEIGLADLGLGAKTNAGYGRMSLEIEGRPATNPRTSLPGAAPPARGRSPLFDELEALRPNEVAGRLPNLVTKAAASIQDPLVRAEWAAAALARIESKAKKKLGEKEWFKTLLEWSGSRGERPGAPIASAS